MIFNTLNDLRTFANSYGWEMLEDNDGQLVLYTGLQAEKGDKSDNPALVDCGGIDAVLCSPCDECKGTRWPTENHEAHCSLNEVNSVPAKPDAPSGYVPCGCRDCMEIAIGQPGEMCNECEEAGCEPDKACRAETEFDDDDVDDTKSEEGLDDVYTADGGNRDERLRTTD